MNKPKSCATIMDGANNDRYHPLLDDPPPPREPMIQVKTVATQCGTAFGIWFLFYAVMVAHCFVVWKWDSSSPPAVVSLDGPIQELSAAIARSVQRISDREEQLSEMGRLVRRMSDKIATLQQQDTTAATAVIPTLPNAADTTLPEEPSPLRLKQLLKIEDIVEYRSAAKAIHMAIQELKNYLVETAAGTTTTAAADQLASVPNLHAAFVAATTTMTYQAISLCSYESGSLSAAQVTAATPTIETNSQNPPINPYMPIVQSVATMESLLETLRVAVDEAKAVWANEQNAQRASCLASLKRPADWLEAGLTAWNHIPDKDVRQALLDVIRHEDGFTDIILDADLNGSSSSSSSPLMMNRHLDGVPTMAAERSVPDVPLRDVLDTPTLHVLATYLDKLLDFVGGFSDVFDNIMDQYVYSLLDSDEDSVGQWAVDRFLNLSGGWTIQQIVDHVYRWTAWMSFFKM
jgi:hypothetical protein